MAKKKKQELTSEELLAEALVREEDWPYQVPGNWVWTRWDTCGDLVAGNGFKPEYQGFANYEIPFYKVGSLKHAEQSGYLFEYENTINEDIRKKLKATLIPPNSILFAKIGEAIRLNRRCLNRINCCIDNNMMAFIPYQICNFRYGYYWTCYKEFYELANSTTVPAIRKSDLQAVPFPLPPLAEQQRIVDRIESLFDKLDHAKELIQEALDSFETRKAAILHQAFTGELTKKWRATHGVGTESWEATIVGNLCKCIVPGRDKPKSFTGSIPWITIPNIEGDFISNTSGELFLTVDEINEVRAKIIPIDSVVMTCVGRFGISAIVADECVINQQLHAFLPSALINNRYLMHNIRYLKDYMEEKATSTTIAYLNKTACNSLPINLPTMKEQEEIVRILDDLFAKEQNAEDLCDLIDQIESIKKTILCRAFRGELGTNVVWEASEVELLKEGILSKKQCVFFK